MLLVQNKLVYITAARTNDEIEICWIDLSLDVMIDYPIQPDLLCQECKNSFHH
jgi:hypothetical protein